MKTKKRVEITFEKVEFIPTKEEMKQDVIYISDKYKTSSHLCLCGCGMETVTPLISGQWSYSVNTNDKLSMSPSVGNYNFPCNSHYIIYKGGGNFV